MPRMISSERCVASISCSISWEAIRNREVRLAVRHRCRRHGCTGTLANIHIASHSDIDERRVSHFVCDRFAMLFVVPAIPRRPARIAIRELRLPFGAGDGEYGLSMAIVSSDVGRAFKLGERLRAGLLHINDQTINDEVVTPFDGVGASGNGRSIGGPAN
ncbi:aldehyde dehydrogenase family protein [Mycetohabitans sp. B4]|nr:aldehyde dehydrogenase family protein [Mycetohabitans sp. B4]